MLDRVKEIKAHVASMGFSPINVVPLLKFWSVIAIQDGQKFNIQLENTDALKVASIHRLVYRHSERDPDKIISVDRRRV